MNPYLLSVLLGIVEGLTEFLPVSSTAHLRISEALMHLPLDEAACSVNGAADCVQQVAYWKMYTIVIQLGAILALMLLFLSRIVGFMRSFPRGENNTCNFFTHPLSLTFVAFVCTCGPALALHKWSDEHLGSMTVIALALLIGGILMWAIDAWAANREPSTHDVEQMGFMQAIWIGLCQSLSAIFPGTSRSMSTIAAGQLVGMDRPAALEFSFLLSIPTMLAATVWDLKKEVLPSHGATAHVVMNAENWVILAIGFVVSFIVALGVVEWFLMWVRRHGFTIFAIYRILLGIAILVFGARFLS